MGIKNLLARIVEKITGRKCSSCMYGRGGHCAHPSDDMFMRCWHGITRPGFAERQELTPEEKHRLEQIVAALDEAQSTARDGGLLED